MINNQNSIIIIAIVFGSAAEEVKVPVEPNGAQSEGITRSISNYW